MCMAPPISEVSMRKVTRVAPPISERQPTNCSIWRAVIRVTFLIFFVSVAWRTCSTHSAMERPQIAQFDDVRVSPRRPPLVLTDKGPRHHGARNGPRLVDF